MTLSQLEAPMTSSSATGPASVAGMLATTHEDCGRIDLNIVSHHGWYQSSSPALVDAIGAQIAIMDNGANKGGSPATLKH